MFVKGQKPWNLGKKHSPEAIAKIKERRRIQTEAGCSLETREKMSESHKRGFREGRRRQLKGKENHNWKGGISWKERHVRQLQKLAGRPRPDYCEVCGNENRICFDHDHVTGKFRGWICNDCNMVLGFSRDNKDTLHKLIIYLETNGN